MVTATSSGLGRTPEEGKGRWGWSRAGNGGLRGGGPGCGAEEGKELLRGVNPRADCADHGV